MIPKARYPLTASEMDYINSRQVDPASIEQIVDEHGTLERLASTALIGKELTRMLTDIAQHPMIDDTGGQNGG